ncbi:Dabb family protein [Nocardia higoensis]|uniref:Dabb family protein n=1 Tax=Nocardia higoensis TaxID=228599 RepID=A0ABS0D3P9_9NOCA|nr:Dabb family protein [Nocardia higoensis]MBF6353109.1 Dabb family protein [Nocardia higoensis]
MYKVTRLLHLADPGDETAVATTIERLTSAAKSADARHTLVARTLPGVRNGGDVLAHLQFGSAAEWARHRAAIDEATSGSAIGHVDAVEYESGPASDAHAGRRQDAGPSRIYRTLLLRVDDAADTAQVRRFEHGTLQMPEHIPAILAWQLSPVRHATGAARWTHVWEQEFADVDELLGPYMHHPIHWGHVDRWFDPECPEQIVKDRVCHSFCAIPAPVIDAIPVVDAAPVADAASVADATPVAGATSEFPLAARRG